MKRALRFLVISAFVLALSITAFADGGFEGNDSVLTYAAIVLIVPAVVAFVMMFAKLSQMNTAVKQNKADNYMKCETFKVHRSSDVFLYSNTVRTPRPKSKN